MTINVPLVVDRWEIRPATHDSHAYVEVWGHVGDYEVMVCLSLNEASRQGLIPYSQVNEILGHP